MSVHLSAPRRRCWPACNTALLFVVIRYAEAAARHRAAVSSWTFTLRFYGAGEKRLAWGDDSTSHGAQCSVALVRSRPYDWPALCVFAVRLWTTQPCPAECPPRPDLGQVVLVLRAVAQRAERVAATRGIHVVIPGWHNGTVQWHLQVSSISLSPSSSKAIAPEQTEHLAHRTCTRRHLDQLASVSSLACSAQHHQDLRRSTLPRSGVT